jgi:Ca-activated chloride channel homolog
MMDFGHPHFAEPQWLWLALLAPALLIGLQVYAGRKRRRQLQTLVAPHFLGELTRSHSAIRRSLKNVLLVLAVAGIGMAMARPQWGVQEYAAHQPGEDIMFVLDCSRSMLAADVPPNRLERAKLAVREFTRRHTDGRVGLVTFAGQAFLQCPLTFDREAFEDALRSVDDKSIAVAGTDVGRALDEAFHAMEKKDRRKIVVLLTDGEDLEKSGATMAESLAKEGMVMFTVGVGTVAGAEIRVVNERGQLELVRDSRGEPVRSRLDETTLRNIAQATKGNYFPLGALGEGLARVRSAITGIDFAEESTMVQTSGVDRFHLPVALALLFLVAESLMGTRRKIEGNIG